ncbi:MAG: tyrosine-type recombinase/integrase [Nitrosomonas sp.]|nr:tyrosine-type recombinase/integrase [Nitrosomonas sp.]
MTSRRLNFTRSMIDNLPYPEKGKRETYYDTNIKALQLRITSTGTKTFCVFRRTKCGDPERITIGQYPEVGIDLARRKAMEINLAISEGLNPQQLKRAAKEEMVFADLFREYLNRYSKVHKKTWQEDEEKYLNHLDKKLGKVKLSAIDLLTISDIHGSITKSGSPIAANRVIALLSSIFGWGISVGFCESNPVIGIRRNRERSRDRFIQSDEMPRFFQALAEEPDTTIRDFILMALLTGARRSNVLSMRWQDINFDRREWRIDETKNGTPQVVTLSKEAIDVLMLRKPRERAMFVFPGIGKSGHLVEPKKGWKRILERAKIEDLRIHDLRRTLGSWQAKTGASLAIIGKSLNHKNQNTTAIYARLDLDPVRESVETATKAIFEAAKK